MKKITLLVLAFLATASCSSDDDKGRSRYIKATIDGTQYTFNTLVVNEEHYNDNGFEYTDVEITGSINNNPDKTISIVVMQGDTGNEASWYFAHFDNGDPYVKDDSFATQVSESTANYVKGTFSGTVVNHETGDTKNISNGSFEVTY